MLTRMLVVACVEAGLAQLFFMHLWVGEAGVSVVRRDLHGLGSARDAVWVDRQLPYAGRSGALFQVIHRK